MTRQLAVVRNELLLHLVSFRFVSSSTLFVILAGVATLSGALDYELRFEAYESRVERYREELRRVSVYSYLQPMVVRPPSPMSFLARGFEGSLGDEVRIHVYAIPAAAENEYRDNPYLATFRGIDLTTIVQVVLGLQALLLTFDAMAGEREKKNLQLILAQSVSRSGVLAGKFFGAFLALLIPLSASGLLSVWLLGSQRSAEPAAGQWLRLAGIFGGYSAYLGIMLLVGLLLSLMAPSAPKSLAYVILAWLLLLFLFPQMVTTTVRLVIGRGHGPLRVEAAVARLDQELEDQLRDTWRAHPLRRGGRNGYFAAALMTRQNRSELRRYGSASYYDAVADYHQRATALGMRQAERVFELRRDQLCREDETERTVRWWTSLSPALLLERFAESLAGTSIADYDAFLADCRAYREELIEYLRGHAAFESWRWFTDDPPETQPWPTFLGFAPDEVDETNFTELWNRFASPETHERILPLLAEPDPTRLLKLADLPPFQLHPAGLRQAVRRVVPELAILSGLGGALAAGAIRRFARYELG